MDGDRTLGGNPSLDAEGPADSEAPALGEPQQGRPWSRLDLYALLGISLVAAVLRLWQLGEPSRQVFDEQFYAKDACHYATGLIAECGLKGRIIEVHPPMGKWMMGLGIKLFGFNAFGSRIMSVVAGVLIVSITYLIARRLLRSTRGASLASLFVAFDLLHFVHSRLGIIEIFVALFAALGFLGILYDKDYSTRDQAALRGWWRPWLFFAGVSGGAAVAVKWSGGPVLLAMIALTMMWDWSATREREGLSGAHRLRSIMPAAGLYLVLVPLVVYALTYVSRVPGASGPWSATWFQGFWDQQVLMFDYFRIPRPEHLYESAAWRWLLIPTDFPYEVSRFGERFAEIVGVAHPLTWIPATVALAVGAIRWVRRPLRRWPEGFIVLGFASIYFLWFVPSLLGFTHSFLYYLLPAIPFMAIALAAVCQRASVTRLGRRCVGVYIAGVVGFFLFMYPMLTHRFIEPQQWRVRALIYDICPMKTDLWRQFQVTTLLHDQCERAGLN